MPGSSGNGLGDGDTLERELDAMRDSLARGRADHEPLDTERTARELAEVQAHLRDLARQLREGGRPSAESS